VPREQIRALDGRVKALETAVRRAEEDEWRRSDPEARTRAEETVAMLSAEIDKLTEKIAKAEARGDRQAAGKAKDSIATYQTWLDQARQTLTEFTG
jgi:FtsZ-binding cell division protein ZapB